MAAVEIDPVCKMEVDPYLAAGKSEYLGQVYYFCSPGCKTAFDREPEKYLPEESGVGPKDGEM